MAQTIPLTIVLGAGNTGLAIGYRVLNVDGTVYSAFTVVNVAETSVLGIYRVAGGIVVPDEGGYVIVGTAATDYGEGTADSNLVGLANDAITSAKIAANAITSSELDATAVAEIADGVWDEILAGHLGAGSTGEALDAIATSDPWLTLLPGAYAPGTAGNIIGNCAVNIVNYIASHISAIGNLLRRRSADLGCLYRGDTWTDTIGGLGDLSTATNIWVAFKKKSNDPDSAALLLVSMDVGLEVINQAPAGALLAAHGSVGIVAPATGGFIDFYVHQDETAKLEPDKYHYDIQVETPYGAGSRIDTRRAGTVIIEGDIVRTTT